MEQGDLRLLAPSSPENDYSMAGSCRPECSIKLPIAPFAILVAPSRVGNFFEVSGAGWVNFEARPVLALPN